jgi:hypothetical protein
MLTEKLISSELWVSFISVNPENHFGFSQGSYSLKLFDFIIKTEKTLLAP